MSNLSNITDKILKDAQDKAAAIIQTAEEKAALERREIISSANLEKDRILAEAEVSAARSKEQILAGNNLDVRNKRLEAKQIIIEKVFRESLEALNNMSLSEFEEFAVNFCKNISIKDGDFIILPEKYKNADIKKINPKLSLYSGERTVSGGFILISGGIERNNTFSALLDFYKSEMESEIISELFGR